MAEFTRMTAAEADTELREMRQLLLQRLASQERLNHPFEVTQRRIHALNRALLSLSKEKPEQGKLIEHPAKPVPATHKPGRSAYGG